LSDKRKIGNDSETSWEGRVKIRKNRDIDCSRGGEK